MRAIFLHKKSPSSYTLNVLKVIYYADTQTRVRVFLDINTLLRHTSSVVSELSSQGSINATQIYLVKNLLIAW